MAWRVRILQVTQALDRLGANQPKVIRQVKGKGSVLAGVPSFEGLAADYQARTDCSVALEEKADGQARYQTCVQAIGKRRISWDSRFEGTERQAERFDHTRLVLWPELSESDRYWLSWLGRYADDHELVEQWQYRDHAIFTERCFEEPELRAAAFLVESLMVMFASRTLRVRFRAALQAATYLGRLEAVQYGPLAMFRDSFRSGQYGLEQALGVQP